MQKIKTVFSLYPAGTVINRPIHLRSPHLQHVAKTFRKWYYKQRNFMIYGDYYEKKK